MERWTTLFLGYKDLKSIKILMAAMTHSFLQYMLNSNSMNTFYHSHPVYESPPSWQPYGRWSSCPNTLSLHLVLGLPSTFLALKLSFFFCCYCFVYAHPNHKSKFHNSINKVNIFFSAISSLPRLKPDTFYFINMFKNSIDQFIR